jgi:hypothetical protein
MARLQELAPCLQKVKVKRKKVKELDSSNHSLPFAFYLLPFLRGLPGFVGPVPPPLVMSVLCTSTRDYSIAAGATQTSAYFLYMPVL